MNVLLLLAHSIAEYDDVRMLSDLSCDVFSIGAYTDPAHPADNMRPPLPKVAYHPELAALCEAQRTKHAGESTEGIVDWAKADLHPDLIDWADVIICHHYLEPWIVWQWRRIRHKRVIWRTCGQSDPRLEEVMGHLRADGLQIIRYSPKEQIAFEKFGVFAGEDALIRFAKYPEDWHGWTGEDPVIGNVTQNMRERHEFCGLSFWLAATEGLPAEPAGPGSEQLPGGIGALSYDEMREYLRRCRAYLYTGTQPASYTLGLIEALMTGVPVMSIGPEHMWAPDLFEAHELVPYWAPNSSAAWGNLRWWLNSPQRKLSAAQRERALELFSVEHIAPQWAAFLGVKVAVAA